MRNDLVLQKIRRVAAASFENAVRLHEDSVLLLGEDRTPSSVHMSVLAIEELGKYFLYENVWYHNRVDRQWTIREMQDWLQTGYSHIRKQNWFLGQASGPILSKPLQRLIAGGKLEQIKQRATYVGIPRKGRVIDFGRRYTTPRTTSARLAQDLVTMVNDYLLDLSLGVRKGFYGLDIPQVDDWLANPATERHFAQLWPLRRPSTIKRLARLREHDDEER